MAQNAFDAMYSAQSSQYNALQGYADDRAKIVAGKSLAAGDQTAARNTLYESGNIPAGQQVEEYGQKQEDRVIDQNKEAVAKKADALIKISQGLKAIPAGQRKAKLDEIGPIFQQVGLDPSIFAHLTEDQLTDQNLDAFTGSVKKEAEQFTLSPGSARYDAKGHVIAEQPFAPNYQKLGEGDTLIQVGGGQPGAAPGGGPPRNMRNNNPGNIEDGPFAQSLPGYKGSDGRFAIFDAPEAGTKAQIALLGSYGKRGINTVQGVINRWAPPSDGNDTSAYAKFVSDKLGVKPGQQIDLSDPVIASDIAAAIQQFEGGPGSASNGGARVLAVGAPKPVKPEDRTDVDPNIVKGLLAGRISPPTQKAAATPYWQAQLQAAAAADPTFDGVNFQARQKARNDFTSGKSADNIKALNTMVGHLDTLNTAIDGLGNNKLRFANVASQWMKTQTGNDANIKTFETAKEAVANELTRVFRGSGGAEADIKAWKSQLDQAGSPQALHAVVKQMAELINSRIEAIGEQYKQGMGTTSDPLQLLAPDKAKAFERLSGNAPTPAQAAPTMATPAKRPSLNSIFGD